MRSNGVCKTQAKSWDSDENEEPIQGTNPKPTLFLILKIIQVHYTEKNYNFHSEITSKFKNNNKETALKHIA